MGRMGVMGRMMDGEPRGLIYEKSMNQEAREFSVQFDAVSAPPNGPAAHGYTAGAQKGATE